MTPQQIIARAWAITKKERTLREWGFFSALFETMRTIELILYQTFYLYWYFKGVTVGWLSVEIMFFENLPFWLFVALTSFIVLMFILQLFVPTLAAGAIIGLGAKAYKNEEVKGGCVLALYNFLQILEIHGLFLLSSATVTTTVMSLILRYGGNGSLTFGMLGFVCFLALFSFLFRLFASFAEEGVVIRKDNIFHSIGRSFKLIISHLGHVVFLGILMVVISLRIVINAVMVLLFPTIVIGLGMLFTSFLSPVISYTITAIIGAILLVVLSYFFAYLHVFKQTVWTITFMELNKLKELDVIEESSS